MAPIARRRLVKRACPEERTSTPIRVWPAPQWDWFSHDERETFFGQDWTVSAKSDRTGYRLEGSPLTGNRPEMLSEPTLPGTIQILPSGQPVVTLPDGPTVGGYPRLGLIDPEDFRLLIQTRPGGKVQFAPRHRTSNAAGQ
jgi:allophanate hydrolase subunit 2